MRNLTLVLVIILILVLMLWRSMFAVLYRRNVLREAAAPHPHCDNTLQRRFRVLERAYAAVIAESGFDTRSDEVCRCDGSSRAKAYLRRIVALTGATQTDEGYFLDVAKTRFHVCDRYVRRLRDLTNPQCGYDKTCFYCVHRDVPREEQIASVLLQLKNAPELFDKWAMHYDRAFKADGQMFTRAQ